MRGLMQKALWTELLEALRADYPDVKFDNTSGPAVTRFVKSNADFMFDVTEENARLKEGEE